MNDVIRNWEKWPLQIVRVPDAVIPASLAAEVELYMVAGSSLPFGNTKALTVLGLLLGAEDRGELKGKHTLVEGTSGNTGKVLSAMAPQFGIKNVVLVMEPDVPNGKRFPGIAHGAKILPPEDGSSTIATARNWGTRDGWLNLDQYSNEDGLRLHRLFTGPKIVECLGEVPGLAVAAIGTGGTIGGVSEYLRAEGGSEIADVLLENLEEAPGMRDEDGMKQIKLPWRGYADAVLKVCTRESYYVTLCLIRATGVSFGPTSGSAYLGALQRLLRHQKEGTLDTLRRGGKIRVAIIGADGYEVYGDRFDAQIHRNHSKPGVLPLPWAVLPERYRSFRL